MLTNSLSGPPFLGQSPDLPAELAELQATAQAAEIEALARWTFDDRRATMDRSVVIYDAKRRVSRWSNQQRRKYRKVAYTLGFVVDYSTHSIDASWKWLAAKHQEIHHERIGESTFRRLANEMQRLGLLDIAENWSTYENEEYAGRQRWNTFTIHVGLAIQNGDMLAVHDWNAPLADPVERALAECQVCGNGFDPKRPDAGYCSPRCRKAASRARDVTDNEHLGEHLPEHLGEHPNQFSNPSNKHFTHHNDGDDEAVPSGEISREEINGSSSARDDEEVPGASAPRPSSAPGSSAARPNREDRGLAEDVINRINEVVHVLEMDFLQLSVSMGKSPVTRLLSRYSADDLVSAVAWRCHYDGYAGEVWIKESVDNMAAVLMSRLGDLADEWIEFRTHHGVETYAEYLAVREAQEDAASAAGDKIFKLMNKAVVTDSEEEALAIFAKASELYQADSGDLIFNVDLVYSDFVQDRVLEALAQDREELFLSARARHARELEEQGRARQKQEEDERYERLKAHQKEHPDHYTVPCGACRHCTNGDGERWCPRKHHRADSSPECIEASEKDTHGRGYSHTVLFPDHYARCGVCSNCTHRRDDGVRRSKCSKPIHLHRDDPQCQEFVELDAPRRDEFERQRAEREEHQAAWDHILKTFAGVFPDDMPDALREQTNAAFEAKLGFPPCGLSAWTIEQFGAAESYFKDIIAARRAA